jgi:hypothetical protein
MLMVRDSIAIHWTGNNSYHLTRRLVICVIRSEDYRFIYFSLFFAFVILHLSGHSEIGHFDDSVIGQKDIAGGQITVQNLLGDGKFLLNYCVSLSLRLSPFCWPRTPSLEQFGMTMKSSRSS